MANETVIGNGLFLGKDGVVQIVRDTNEIKFFDSSVPLGVKLVDLVGGGGAAALPDLTDVNAALAPADGQIFFYNGSGPYWDSKILDGTPNVSFTINSDDGDSAGVLYGGATGKSLEMAASVNTKGVAGGQMSLAPTAAGGVSIENWSASAFVGRAKLYQSGSLDLFDIELKGPSANALFRFSDDGTITVYPSGVASAKMLFDVGVAGAFTYTFPAFTGAVPIYSGVPSAGDLLAWNVGGYWEVIPPAGATAQTLDQVLATGDDAFQKNLNVWDSATTTNLAFSVNYTAKQVIVGSPAQDYDLHLYGDIVMHSDIIDVANLGFKNGTGAITISAPGDNNNYALTLPAISSTIATISDLAGFLPLTGGVINGDLTINGTTTTVNTTNLEVADKTILINKGGGIGSGGGSGLQVEENSAIVNEILYNAGGYWEVGAPGNLDKVAIQSGVGSYDLADFLPLSGGSMTGNIDLSIGPYSITGAGSIGTLLINGHVMPVGAPSQVALQSDSISAFSDVVYSPAPVAGNVLVYQAGGYWSPQSAVGDNLGNHTATQALNMSTFGITNAGSLNTHIIPGGTSTLVVASNNLNVLADVDYPAPPSNGQVLTWNGGTSQWEPAAPTGGGDNLGNHIATQSLYMSGYNIYGDSIAGADLDLFSSQAGFSAGNGSSISLASSGDIFFYASQVSGPNTLMHQMVLNDAVGINALSIVRYVNGSPDRNVISITNTGVLNLYNSSNFAAQFDASGLSATRSLLIPNRAGTLVNYTAGGETGGDMLAWDAGTSSWILTPAAHGTTASIKDHVDVSNTMTPSNGDVLTWDNGASEWTAAAISIPTWVPTKTTNSSLGVGTHLLDTFDSIAGDSSGSVWHYSIERTDVGNEAVKTGTIHAAWIGTGTPTTSEVSTTPIGDTSGASFSVQNSAGTINLNLVVTAGTWTARVVRNDL